jgi:hypothetical protein
MEHFYILAISRSSFRISGEKVRAILSLRGCPDGGLAIRGSYNVRHLNVHKIFHGDILEEIWIMAMKRSVLGPEGRGATVDIRS